MAAKQIHAGDAVMLAFGGTVAWISCAAAVGKLIARFSA